MFGSGFGAGLTTNPTNLSQQSAFGTTPQNSQSFFGAQQNTGGMFGNQQQQQQQQQPATNLFGSSTQQNTQPSMFGSQKPAAPAGGLFGSASQQTSSTNFFSTPQPTQSIFGAKPAATGLFGTQTSMQQPNTGMFGTATQAPNLSMFGGQQQQQNSNSLFGTPASQTMSLLGTKQPSSNVPSMGAFGNAMNTSVLSQQQQQVQLQQQQSSNVPLTVHGLVGPSVNKQAKYSELPEDMRQALDGAEKYIQEQISACQTLLKSSIPDVLSSIHHQVRDLQEKTKKVKNLLSRDMTSIEEMRIRVSLEIRNAEMAGRYISKYTNPHQLTFTSRSDEDISRYFETTAVSLERKLIEYQSAINDIEQVIAERVSQTQQINPQSIKSILQGQNDLFLALSRKIAVLHDQIAKERHQFDQWKKAFSSKNDMDIIPRLSILRSQRLLLLQYRWPTLLPQPNSQEFPWRAHYLDHPGSLPGTFPGSVSGSGMFARSTTQQPMGTTTPAAAAPPAGTFGLNSNTTTQFGNNGTTSSTGAFGSSNTNPGLFGSTTNPTTMTGFASNTGNTSNLFGNSPSTGFGSAKRGLTLSIGK